MRHIMMLSGRHNLCRYKPLSLLPVAVAAVAAAAVALLKQAVQKGAVLVATEVIGAELKSVSDFKLRATAKPK